MTKTIVLDPGHGGSDPGASGFNLLEKYLTLKISKKVVNELLPYQCIVRMTRKTDSSLTLGARAEIANSLDASLFVSIHINAGGGTGFESYIYRHAPGLAGTYRSAIHSQVADYLKKYGMADRGPKKAGFAVLRLTRMPALLLENLFIDSGKDVSLLTNEPFIAGLSYSIALGIAGALSIPMKENPWNPSWEITELINDRIINDYRDPGADIHWGETATALNRMRGVPPHSPVWNPEGEIVLLIRDKIINTPRKPGDVLLWGEFATSLNRLRERAVSPAAWDPAAEINALMADRLLFTPRDPAARVLWGEFATVLNRHRGVGG